MTPITHANHQALALEELSPPKKKQNEKYTTKGIILDFFKERLKDIAKIIRTGIFWTGKAVTLPPSVSNLSNTMEDFGNFITIAETPKKGVELGGALHGLGRSLADKITSGKGSWEKVGTEARGVFKHGTGFVSNVVSGVKFFGSRFAPISKAAKNLLSKIGFAATAGSAGNGAIEQIQKLNATDAKDTPRKTLYMLQLSRDVSFFALGVIGLWFAFTGVGALGLAVAGTAGLVFSLSGYFYEKTRDPEHKGKNLDPEAVLANRMARV